MPAEPSRPTDYLLRGLLYCRQCGEALRPAYATTRRRFYLCPYRACHHPPLAAEPIESYVWVRYTQLNEPAAARLPADDLPRRREALLDVLARISIGSTPDDIEIHWRD